MKNPFWARRFAGLKLEKQASKRRSSPSTSSCHFERSYRGCLALGAAATYDMARGSLRSERIAGRYAQYGADDRTRRAGGGRTLFLAASQAGRCRRTGKAGGRVPERRGGH